jgi:hypothetical protein
MASPDGRPVFFNVDIPWHLEARNDDSEQYPVSESHTPWVKDHECQCPQCCCGIRVVTTRLFGNDG